MFKFANFSLSKIITLSIIKRNFFLNFVSHDTNVAEILMQELILLCEKINFYKQKY